MRKKRKKVVLDFTGQKSIVDQSARDRCNLNILLKSYNKSPIPVVPVGQEIMNLISSSENSYSDMLITVQNAMDSFLQLPSAVRARFRHNPQQLLNFIADKANYDEAVQLGLITPKEQPAPPANAPAGEAEDKKRSSAKADESTKKKKNAGEASQHAEGGQSD